MNPIRTDITFNMNTILKDQLKEYSHTIGLKLPEILEILSTITAIKLITDNGFKEIITNTIEQHQTKESPKKTQISFRIDTFFNTQLENFANSIGIKPHELIEIVSTTYTKTINSEYRKLITKEIAEYKIAEQANKIC